MPLPLLLHLHGELRWRRSNASWAQVYLFLWSVHVFLHSHALGWIISKVVQYGFVAMQRSGQDLLLLRKNSSLSPPICSAYSMPI